jgi:hypothetical protein
MIIFSLGTEKTPPKKCKVSPREVMTLFPRRRPEEDRILSPRK